MALRETPKMNPRSADEFARALERYLPDAANLEGKDAPSNQRQPDAPHPDRLPIQASIDLHGQTLEQARRSVDKFLKESANRGLRKILIIHGKGSGILQTGIRDYLEGHPLAGRRTIARREEGGSGALVVIVRQK